jgi:hypothetical protein
MRYLVTKRTTLYFEATKVFEAPDAGEARYICAEDDNDNATSFTMTGEPGWIVTEDVDDRDEEWSVEPDPTDAVALRDAQFAAERRAAEKADEDRHYQEYLDAMPADIRERYLTEQREVKTFFAEVLDEPFDAEEAARIAARRADERIERLTQGALHARDAELAALDNDATFAAALTNAGFAIRDVPRPYDPRDEDPT